MVETFAQAAATGLSGPSKIQKNLTTSAVAKATREELELRKQQQEFDRNLEIGIEAGIFERDGKTVRVTANAIENLNKLSQGNRETVANALLMNQMMGSYTSEQDGKLIKKKNRQVFPPMLAKSGAVPNSVEQGAAAGNASDIELKKQYESGAKQGFITPAINQEGRFSILNLFGTDKADDVPTVYTESEVLAGLNARADKFNIDGSRLFPGQYRELRRLESTGEFGISNLGGGTDESYIELVNGVFDENVGRGTTNAFLKNLETIYNANPRYYADTVTPASKLDPTIEAGSEQDVDITTPGAAKTFEQAYPTLQGLDGERLATELENLQESGQLDQFGEQQITQIFTDLKNEGIGSIPDLIKKRSEQKKSVQEQYKEVLYLNTVAARPDNTGKLILPNGKTPKEATDEMINAYYTGIPDGDVTAKDLAASQNARRTNILADRKEDNVEDANRTAAYTARTERLAKEEKSALDYAKFEFTKYKYFNDLKIQADKDTLAAFEAIEDKYAENVQGLKDGSYAGEGGISFVDHTENLKSLLRGGQASSFSWFSRGSGPNVTKESTQFRQFANDVTSVSIDYYNASKKNSIGRDNIDNAKRAFLSIAKDEKQKANLEKMWQNEGHDIYAYNYAQPERFLEHKFMQEEVILQKVFSSLENDESIWNSIFGGIPIVRNLAGKGTIKGGQRLNDFWGDVWADDLSQSALVNSLKDAVAIRYEDNKPVEIVAKSLSDGELEDSVDLDKFISQGSITGTELNWLINNLDKIGDYTPPGAEETTSEN